MVSQSMTTYYDNLFNPILEAPYKSPWPCKKGAYCRSRLCRTVVRQWRFFRRWFFRFNTLFAERVQPWNHLQRLVERALTLSVAPSWRSLKSLICLSAAYHANIYAAGTVCMVLPGRIVPGWCLRLSDCKTLPQASMRVYSCAKMRLELGS